ncbi:hypothetical protein CR162_15200 [Pseudoroseomonas rhizosphaerae]|uniref:Uncharacterized protein n=1 Tax=Teichococcus rhizosphaerae TaxID=1335062 RepID=A0A2C7A225_9PROT|nr:hypothetical protein [Pseudoroseomonas rhizosphaerae]PHK94108.1 hypothetical protein CR162_15200 [Pseudoroseomonas rhizosphaerae]
MVHITSKAIGKVALAATLLLGVAACAQPGGPPAATPTSSQMSLSPAPIAPPGSSAATATSGAQGSMGSMPGHDMSSMQGHNMGGMNMQQMMQHCQQMRAQAQQGSLSPQMQQMMQHCQMMNH